MSVNTVRDYPDTSLQIYIAYNTNSPIQIMAVKSQWGCIRDKCHGGVAKARQCNSSITKTVHGRIDSIDRSVEMVWNLVCMSVRYTVGAGSTARPDNIMPAPPSVRIRDKDRKKGNQVWGGRSVLLVSSLNTEHFQRIFFFSFVGQFFCGPAFLPRIERYQTANSITSNQHRLFRRLFLACPSARRKGIAH